MPTDGEDALPAGDGIRPDDRVDRPQDFPNVLRGATRLVVELEAVALRRGGETGLVEGDGQGLEELLVGLAEEVVDLISGRPKSIYKLLASQISRTLTFHG